jgi:HK97 family phage portal protein
MKFGPVEITLRKKSYSDLVTMMRREKEGSVTNLKTQPRTQLSEYKSWASSCVSLISDRISTLPYSFYNKNTGEELTTKNKGYQIYTKPFRNPNDIMSFRFIKAFCQIQLDMCGMAFVYIARNKLGQVWELWPLNMNDFIKCDVSDDLVNPTVKYHFKSGITGFIDFDISELVCLTYVHPLNPYIGASPIQSQAYAQDIDSYIEIYERDFFKNSARIDFALTTDEKIDQIKADELKERWREKYQGSYHDVAVLDSGLKPVPVSYANRDFEFLNLAKWTMEKVFAAYRVPKSKLGFGDNGRSGDVQSDISFNRESVQPRLSLWDEEITKEVMSSFNENIEFKHQNPIPRDRLIEVQEGRIHVGLPTVTLNEFREKTHQLEAVAGGDRIFISKDMVPLDRIDEVIDAQLLAQTATDDEDDDRDDEPDSHVNPDGSDDRDDNPTDDRSIDLLGNGHFKIICDAVRETINDFIRSRLVSEKKPHLSYDDEKSLENSLKYIFADIITGMVDHMLDYFGEKAIYKGVDLVDWMAPISDKVVVEYKNTLTKNPKWNDEDWNVYFNDQLDSNPRLSKITNSLSRACINYAKWLILRNHNSEMSWIVNSNECGHRGKLKDNISKDQFQIGNMKLHFPNEVLNFSCDCTLTENKLLDKE